MRAQKTAYWFIVKIEKNKMRKKGERKINQKAI